MARYFVKQKKKEEERVTQIKCGEYRAGFAQAAVDVYQFLRESPGVSFRRFLDFVLVFSFARYFATRRMFREERKEEERRRGKEKRKEGKRERETKRKMRVYNATICQTTIYHFSSVRAIQFMHYDRVRIPK